MGKYFIEPQYNLALHIMDLLDNDDECVIKYFINSIPKN